MNFIQRLTKLLPLGRRAIPIVPPSEDGPSQYQRAKMRTLYGS